MREVIKEYRVRILINTLLILCLLAIIKNVSVFANFSLCLLLIYLTLLVVRLRFNYEKNKYRKE